MEGAPADVQDPLPEIRLIALSGLRAKKSLGQHFLKDRRVIHEILELAGLDSSNRILEIGPGRGALTFPLSARVERLLAVEKDRDLAALLQERLAARKIENAEVICCDILRFDFSILDEFSRDRIHVIGNLPYNVSTPVLETLIDHRERFRRAVLMFQKEVADRLAASPGGRSYGALTVLVGLHARVRRLLRVGKKSFHPIPRVDSTVVELDFDLPHSPPAPDEARFRAVVKGAFSHRRKTLQNALLAAFPAWDRDAVGRVLADCRIEPGRRAETLSIDDFLRLSEAFPPILQSAILDKGDRR